MAAEDVVKSALAAGVKEFREEHWSKALRIFGRGVEEAQRVYETKQGRRIVASYINLLDSRAACYVKLDRADKALEDSDREIELDPYSTKGYLRKSKVLCGVDRQKEALDILDVGVRKIAKGLKKHGAKLKVNEMLYGKLKAERTRLMGQLNYEVVRDGDGRRQLQPKLNDRDPVVRLPNEIVCKIFRSLDQYTLLNAMLVSKMWHDGMMTLADLARNPELAGDLTANKFAKFVGLCEKVFTNPNRRDVSSLTLKMRKGQERAILKQLGESRIQLRHVTLKCWTENPIARQLQRDDNFSQFFFSISHVTLVISRITKAQDLLLILAAMRLAEKLDVLIEDDMTNELPGVNPPEPYIFPSLESMKIILPPYSKWQRPYDYFCEWCQVPNLTRLFFDGWDMGLDSFGRLVSSKLKHVSLWHISTLTLFELFGILSSSGCHPESLESCQELDRPATIPDFGARQVAERSYYDLEGVQLSFFDEMSYLFLSGTHLSNKGFFRIISQSTLPNLRTLKLQSNRNIVFGSGTVYQFQPQDILSFDELFSHCPNITRLMFDRCTNFDNNTCKRLAVAMENHGIDSQLEALDLSNNPAISDYGIARLFHKGTNLHLRLLAIHGLDVSAETVNALRKNYCTTLAL